MSNSFFNTSSSNETEESEYGFTPVRNDSSDEFTESLFEQLEEGHKYHTDIYGACKSGANLYAKKIDNDIEGCLPIHIAAYNVGWNTEAIELILQSFDDPEERKKYIYAQDDTNRNVLEILIEEAEREGGYAMPSIKAILSFLNVSEQQSLLDSLSDSAKSKLSNEEDASLIVLREEGINDLGQLSLFLSNGENIKMCDQRRKEEAKTIAKYDSDEESLGKLNSVYNKKFVARVAYKDTTKGGIITSKPELTLIPSSWRLDTAVEGSNQGDHVTAYVLLLSAFSYCRGENIKTLPERVYNLAVSVLPGYKKTFLGEKKKIEETVKEHSSVRKEVLGSLNIECGKSPEFLSIVENNLKKIEIESIARHIEDGIDKFIILLNKIEGESFSQKRKESVKEKYLLKQLILILEKADIFKENKYDVFKKILMGAISSVEEGTSNDSSSITEGTLKKIVGKVYQNISKNELKTLPRQLLSKPRGPSKSRRLTKALLLEFLRRNVPLKKYHEGQAINDIGDEILVLKNTHNQEERNKLLGQIGFLCFKLFDYPRVEDEELNDENVLYAAIPRHLIIINAAFSELAILEIREKELLYNSFLKNILKLQFWSQHKTEKNKEKVPLTPSILKEKILKFADLDENHNFSMKPSKKPTPLLSSSSSSLDNTLNDDESTSKSKVLFPRSISGWQLQDVKDQGNCFYEAVAHQLQLQNHSFINAVPSGTHPEDSVRLAIQGQNFRDGEWADFREILKFCREFNAIVGVVDTRSADSGFVYYYITEEGMKSHTDSDQELPSSQLLIRVAFTGNHYLSVIKTAREQQETQKLRIALTRKIII